MSKTKIINSSNIHDKKIQMNALINEIGPHLEEGQTAFCRPDQSNQSIDLLTLHRKNRSLLRELHDYLGELSNFTNTQDINELVKHAEYFIEELSYLEIRLEKQAPIPQSPRP